MKKAILYLAVLFTAAVAPAQHPAPSASVPPLPVGPLLNRTPGFCRWTVTTRTGAGGPPGQSASGKVASDKKEETLSQVTYTKTGTTILEEDLLSSGRKQQVWHVGQLTAAILPDGSPPILSSGVEGEFDSVNFTQSDFAGLDWISPQTYVGMADQKGRKCLVFQGAVLALSSMEATETAMTEQAAMMEANSKLAHPGVVDYHFDMKAHQTAATVYIDLETRLPLLMTFVRANKPQTREYVYLPPPTTALAVPPVLSQAFNLNEKRIQDFARPVPPP